MQFVTDVTSALDNLASVAMFKTDAIKIFMQSNKNFAEMVAAWLNDSPKELHLNTINHKTMGNQSLTVVLIVL